MCQLLYWRITSELKIKFEGLASRTCLSRGLIKTSFFFSFFLYEYYSKRKWHLQLVEFWTAKSQGELFLLWLELNYWLLYKRPCIVSTDIKMDDDLDPSKTPKLYYFCWSPSHFPGPFQHSPSPSPSPSVHSSRSRLKPQHQYLQAKTSFP